jgi:aminomethyltransferase
MKKTALHDKHIALKAKMAEFAGYEMPIQYSGIVDEHMAVRNASGVFDVSHMGNFFISGKDAVQFLDSVLTCDMTKITIGQAVYTLMCYPTGSAVDDLIVYALRPDYFMLIVNASNIDKDFAWLQEHKKGEVVLENRSESLSILAVQGPKAVENIDSLSDGALSSMKSFTVRESIIVSGFKTIVARTGYTGEDGCEIIIDNSDAPVLWDILLSKGVKPVGLGARDTLRLEMGYTLYGHEINAETNVLEAGLGWIINLDKAANYPGKTSLISSKASGLKRRLIGLVSAEKGIPRAGCEVWQGGKKIGVVTSGGQSPMLNKGVALALVDAGSAATNEVVEVDVRGRKIAHNVTKRKFV